MSGSGTFTLQGVVNALATGEKHVGPLTISATQAVAETDTIALDTGDTTVSFPLGATAVILVPAAGNTATLTLKGDAGDTGIPFAATLPFLLAPSDDFIINSDDDDQSVEAVWL